MFGALFEVEMFKKCTPMWRDAHLQVKKLETLQHWSTSRSCAIEKVHAVVARRTFPSQSVFFRTPCSDHFWKLRCRKSARRCGAKHISKSKMQKTDGYGALLDVQVSFRVARCKGLCTLSKVSKT